MAVVAWKRKMKQHGAMPRTVRFGDRELPQLPWEELEEGNLALCSIFAQLAAGRCPTGGPNLLR